MLLVAILLLAALTSSWTSSALSCSKIYLPRTAGDAPYKTIKHNADVAVAVSTGHRMEQAHFCPDMMYALLVMCWATDEANRPTAQAVADRMPEIVNEVRSSHSSQNPFGHHPKAVGITAMQWQLSYAPRSA